MTDQVPLRMYVWENVLCDYRCGMAVALAHSEEEARQLIAEHPMFAGDDFENPPTVVDTPAAFLVWGGD